MPAVFIISALAATYVGTSTDKKKVKVGATVILIMLGLAAITYCPFSVTAIAK